MRGLTEPPVPGKISTLKKMDMSSLQNAASFITDVIQELNALMNSHMEVYMLLGTYIFQLRQTGGADTQAEMFVCLQDDVSEVILSIGRVVGDLSQTLNDIASLVSSM
jgi:hypothetical protein